MPLEHTYQYTPITVENTIRLVELHPGNESDQIHLSLITTTLDAAPDFEAISYCWGDASLCRSISCGSDLLYITYSLFGALAHFRPVLSESSRPRMLWADAVCINQADSAEKTAQVLLMPRIYTQAARVLIWLGEAHDPLYEPISLDVAANIRAALALLPQVVPQDTKELAAGAQALRLDTERLRAGGRPNLLDHDWIPLMALLSRPWFRRKWIVQEVALAKEPLLYAGSGIEIPWSELAKLTLRIDILGIRTLVLTEMSSNERKYWRGQLMSENQSRLHKLQRSFLMTVNCVTSIYAAQILRHRATLVDGVVATMFFQCTNPRDHVYSLLGLGADGPSVIPDYGASVADVFKRFAITMLVKSCSLKVLSLAPHRMGLCDLDKPRLEGLPTWVPDMRYSRENVITSFTFHPQAFFAGGKGKPDLKVSLDERLLSCQGRVIDTIKALGRSLGEMMVADIPELLHSFEGFSDPLPDRKRQRISVWLREVYKVAFGRDWRNVGEMKVMEIESLEAFSRTVLCGLDPMRNRVSSKLISAFPRWMELFIEGEEERYESDEVSASVDINEILMRWTIAQKFCLTVHGRFGNVANQSRVGDRICVLVGGEVPFIIRPTGRGTYILAGPCYVDGIMDGEALETGYAATDLIEGLETIQLE